MYSFMALTVSSVMFVADPVRSSTYFFQAIQSCLGGDMLVFMCSDIGYVLVLIR